MNVHLHALVLDGVYVHASDDPRSPLEFRELLAPTHADIAEVAARTAARVERILRAHGRSLDPELDDGDAPEVCLDEPGLAACYAAAAQGVAAPRCHRLAGTCSATLGYCRATHRAGA